MIEQLTRTSEDRIPSQPGIASVLRHYLALLLAEISARAESRRPSIGAAALPSRIFETLASREFCALSLGRVAGSHEAVVASVQRALRRSEPIHFYYGLGGGHATHVASRTAQRVFDVGLAELLLLRQVTGFGTRVGQIYPPGVRFSLVIDNLSASLVDDVPLTRTLAYCRKLRQLVDDVTLGALTGLIVTSECFSVSDLADAWPDGRGVQDLAALTARTHRPTGREPIGLNEAAECARRVRAVRLASERLLAPMIRGVYLTERTSTASLGFRPFPGADACAERGEVVLTRKGRTALGPMVLTSANRVHYDVQRYRLPDVLPASISEVAYAERVSD